MQATVSNRLEELAEALSEDLQNSSPFERKLVLVPSQLVRAWLEQFLAKRLPSGTFGIDIQQLFPNFKKSTQDEVVILFGWSALAPTFFEFFKTLPNCHFFLFSPCMLFLGRSFESK